VVLVTMQARRQGAAAASSGQEPSQAAAPGGGQRGGGGGRADAPVIGPGNLVTGVWAPFRRPSTHVAGAG
jgi:hypothetical protein